MDEIKGYHKVYSRKCPICGKEFQTPNPKLVYDTNLCSRRGRKAGKTARPAA
jgi:endogenous inhibitor of DNA gyrase (YacG/DUF329 family)